VLLPFRIYKDGDVVGSADDDPGIDVGGSDQRAARHRDAEASILIHDGLAVEVHLAA